MEAASEWLNFPLAKDAILFLLAIYGALLSTFNWRKAVVKDRRILEVAVSTAMPVLSSGLGSCFAKIEAVNVGQRQVTVTALTFALPSGERLAQFSYSNAPGMLDTKLPSMLVDGQAAQSYLSYSEVANALLTSGRGKTKLTPICEISTGQIFKGAPWEVDPKEWQSM